MDTPARLLLVRHGVTDWNRERRWQGHTDIPLNDEGRAQAGKVAERLKDEGITALYTSDLQRAAETADTIGRALGVDAVRTTAFREISLGELEGTAPSPDTHRGEAVSETARNGGPLAPGAEAFETLEARLVEGYRAICDAHAGETVGIVSHGGALRTLIAHLVGIAPTHIDRMSLKRNTCVSEIDFRLGHPQLTLINCGRHLDDGTSAPPRA